MNKLGRGPLRDATYQISKALSLPVSESKIVEDFLMRSYVLTCDPPPPPPPVRLQGDHLNKTGRDSVEDATHQTSKLYMSSSFTEEDFQRFCIFFLLIVMATRVMDGIKLFKQFLLYSRKIPAKFHQD